LYEIECFHTFGTPHLERLKVTALNLFHLTASPPFRKVGSFYITTQPLRAGLRFESPQTVKVTFCLDFSRSFHHNVINPFGCAKSLL